MIYFSDIQENEDGSFMVLEEQRLASYHRHTRYPDKQGKQFTQQKKYNAALSTIENYPMG
jgi:hypothetical protein